jgi:hypothetical protein
MPTFVYVIGFVLFALAIWWLARGSRDRIEPEEKPSDDVHWFPDGGTGPGQNWPP